ncbi:hypothetical protein HaLaN_30731, partial [Haematococcus lacustris]
LARVRSSAYMKRVTCVPCTLTASTGPKSKQSGLRGQPCLTPWSGVTGRDGAAFIALFILVLLLFGSFSCLPGYGEKLSAHVIIHVLHIAKGDALDGSSPLY